MIFYSVHRTHENFRKGSRGWSSDKRRSKHWIPISVQGNRWRQIIPTSWPWILGKVPTRRELLNAQLRDQARDAAAAKQKNIELEGQVQELKEKLANEAAERAKILEEHRIQMQVEPEKERNEFKEEMLALMAKQRADLLQQVIQLENDWLPWWFSAPYGC